jgi:alpha-glucosidase
LLDNFKLYKMKKIIFNFSKTLLLAAMFFACAKKEQITTVWNVFSPDSTLQASVTLNSGKLTYTVLSAGDTVIKTSDLGISRTDQSFIDGLLFVEAAPINTVDEKYTMMTGKRKENRSFAKELTITFKNKSEGKLQVIFRAYNDGVAFKYNFPETDAKPYTVNKESTTFAIPTEGKAWVQLYDFPCIWCPAYENWYRETKIGENAPDSSGWSIPALFQTKKYYVLIADAGLNGNYFGARLNQDASKGIYKIRMPFVADGDTTGSIYPTSSLPWATPWRTLIIGKTPGTLIESNLVHHLADPQVAGDFSWVKPGRSSWSWWSENDSPRKMKRLKEYVDLAAEMGWEYSLVDAWWNKMENGDTITDLIKYANSKNVNLALWYNSGGPHNHMNEIPRDILHDPALRKAEFKKLRDWGIKAIKIDFFHSDKQNMIQYYYDLMKDAAEYHLLVDFHGSTVPRGWPRTYPNMISMEGVKGSEQYRWDTTYPAKTVIHHNILPYTRNVIGPMDYTPVSFSDYKCCPHQTTNAHELALGVLFESGIQHYADNVESFRKQDAKVKELLKATPATWDDIKFIEGEPGKLTVLARQKADSWFIAGTNGETVGKDINVALPFIAEGKYKLTLYSDGATSRKIDVKDSEYTGGSAIPVKVFPNGGFVAWIRK